MASLPDSARQVVESGHLAHLVTVNLDGTPEISCVWVGMLDGDIAFGSLGPRRKLENLQRNPRIALSIEAGRITEDGVAEYLVVHGRARITEGGGPELLQRLAETYIGPGVKFPPMDDPPPGVVVRITPEHIGGVGPWNR